MTVREKLKTTPPPLICAAILPIALALDVYWPLVSIEVQYRYALGGFFAFGSILMMPGIILKFRRLNTPFDVRKSPSALITDGLYTVSRNPSYVALVLLFIGIGVTLSNFWIFILLIPCIVVIDRYVIPEEEVRLEQAFGDKFRTYKTQVRRWI